MPQDLPGFYFDAERNRYFPINGPIPGSSRKPSSSSTATQNSVSGESDPNLEKKPCRKTRIEPTKLLYVRELCGNVITSGKGKQSFLKEYLKIQASQPLVWKYSGTKWTGDGALEQMRVDLDTPHGLIGTDILLAGSMTGSLSLFEVGKGGQQSDFGVKYLPGCVWPLNTGKHEGFVEVPRHLWRPAGPSMLLSSNISSIKICGKSNNGLPIQHAVITTLGSDTSGGSVSILNLSEPLDYFLSSPMIWRRMNEITPFNCTIWSADCNSDGSQAMVGTNFGAALVNIETGVRSWVLRCKSDVLSLQLDQWGRIGLCGLRNGTIVTVDARQKSEGFAARFTRRRIHYHSQGTWAPDEKSNKRMFELRGNIFHSHTLSLPSSISSLASLRLHDQYFLASSMDGYIRLYDHRLIKRGPVQIYEGNENAYCRIQLGVDPDERFFMAGGGDHNLRLWDIKSGELLFKDKFMEAVPQIMCWPKEVPGERDGDCISNQNYIRGAWVGSPEGIYYMRWP